MSIPERYRETTEEEWAIQRYGILVPEDVKVTPTVYFDMDGVLAKWHDTSRKNPTEKMTIDEVMEEGYFCTLEPVTEMIEKMRFLKEDCGMNVAILSKAYFHAIEEKTDWIEKNMPFIDTEREAFFVPCTPHAQKANFIPSIGQRDVLIDDYNTNLDEWYGTPVKCLNGINSERDDMVCVRYDTTNEEFAKAIDRAITERAYTISTLVNKMPEQYLLNNDTSEYRQEVEGVIEETMLACPFDINLATQLSENDVARKIFVPLIADEIRNGNSDKAVELADLLDNGRAYVQFDKNADLLITIYPHDDVEHGRTFGVHLSADLKSEIRENLTAYDKNTKAIMDGVYEALVTEILENGKVDVEALKSDVKSLHELLSKCETVADIRELRHNGISEKDILVYAEVDDMGTKEWCPLSSIGDKDSIYQIQVDTYGDNGLNMAIYDYDTDELHFSVIDKEIFSMTGQALVENTDLDNVELDVRIAYEDMYPIEYDSIPVKSQEGMKTFEKPQAENKPNKQVGKEN